MNNPLDDSIAMRILKMLVTPFSETPAFKLGIIDAKGKLKKNVNKLNKKVEKDAYSYLDRLVFNMKRIMNKYPPETIKLKDLTTAMVLIKEAYNNASDIETPLMENNYNDFRSMISEEALQSYPEYELVVKYFSEEGEGGVVGGAPTNNTSGAEVKEPKINKKDIKKYQRLARRPVPVDVTKIV